MVLWIDVGDGNSLKEDDDMMWFGEREVVGEVTVILCEEGIGSTTRHLIGGREWIVFVDKWYLLMGRVVLRGLAAQVVYLEV